VRERARAEAETQISQAREKGKSSGTSASPSMGNRMNAGSHESRESAAGGGNDHPDALDPEEYLHAKKKLRRAVLEHYRSVQFIYKTTACIMY
jgi:hypothetical protein